MTYKFKWEGLLNLRKLKEHREKIKLANVNYAILENRKKIEQAKNDIRNAYNSIEKNLSQQDEKKMLHIYSIYIQERRIYIKEREIYFKKLDKKFQENMKKLFKSREEVEVVEKLKAKKIKHFRRNYKMKIQNEIEDTLMIRKTFKKKKGGGW